LASNSYGLYDMHGNVAEFCKDKYANYPTDAVTDPFCNSGVNCVCRGGSWLSSPGGCRSAMRSTASLSENSFNFYGFRLALVKE
ncbi:MAG: SUMF1/EgtB/PvdO family nonheme iron enzyme, partial [Candidatus Riflebacteria bacterium]|nr:SUMF1/EgtB/PvdO family nonheme iron enzyme [Candidatus Riflebacteria bacterium]